MKPIFIIEHLEPKLWPWCEIEYKSISKITGKNHVWFTNLSSKKLINYGKIIKNSVVDLDIDHTKACILDPLASTMLTPKEAKHYKYIIVGGILGEEKLNGRTKKELTSRLPKIKKYNLGKGQFSTDNAVYVAHAITLGNPLKDIPYKDTIEIHINSVESTILPYRYPLINRKPRISSELINYLKHKKGF